MKICPSCSSVNLEGSTICGMCGSSLEGAANLQKGQPLPPPSSKPVSRQPRNKMLLPYTIAWVIAGVLIFFGWEAATTTSLGWISNQLGLQMLIFGGIMVMALIMGTSGGMFSGWRGWTREWVRRKNPSDPRTAPLRPDEKTDD